MHKHGRLYKICRKIYRRFYRFFTLRILYPSVYKKHAKKEVDRKKLVFLEVRMPELTDNFLLLYEDLKKNYDFDIHVHFLRESFVNKIEYLKRCYAMVKDIATAKYVFLNDASNVIANLPVRKETVITQMWHACGAFKKFGMSTADLLFGDDRKTLQKYPYHGNYTHVTVSSPEVIWAYEEAMSLQKKKGIVKATGISRTDLFFDEEKKRAAFERLYQEIPQAKGKKVILYAPTFRGRVASAKTPNKLDLSLFAQAFRNEYVLLLKHHPFVKHPPLIPEEYQDFALDVTERMSIEELLFVSDICISDYSSLIFEYSLFERPMIFFAFDLEDYFDWRGFYYDYKEFVPGPIFDTSEAIIDYIRNIDAEFDREKVAAFRDRFMGSCDGNATKRIRETVFGDSLKQQENKSATSGENKKTQNKKKNKRQEEN